VSVLDVPATETLDAGRLNKAVTSQLSVLTDAEYGSGIERIRAVATAAAARGDRLFLTADLHLYATFGTVP
jgi:hypothetical protein